MGKALGFLLAVLLFTNTAFATSGACSSHGGVDCSFETISGNAVCDDGFKSSVLYDDMVECRPQCWITQERHDALLKQLGERTAEDEKWAQTNLENTLNAIESGQPAPSQIGISEIADIKQDVIKNLESQLDCSIYPKVVSDPLPPTPNPMTEMLYKPAPIKVPKLIVAPSLESEPYIEPTATPTPAVAVPKRGFWYWVNPFHWRYY